MYNFLFKAAWETLCKFSDNQGVRTGMICIVHTWGQNLSFHPHLHCIVPGGGLRKCGKWKNFHNTGKFLFPVKALSKVFRAKYVALLRKENFSKQELIESLFAKPWVVYAKQPFAHPSCVVEYLGRYTHKVAISNNRILSYQNSVVCFSYKDYRHAGVKKEMTLTDMEFIRRYSMHFLPAGFVRIRHYGILSSSCKRNDIPCIRKQLPDQTIRFIDLRKPRIYDRTICTCCGTPSMVTIETIPGRGPPKINLSGGNINQSSLVN